LAESLDQVARSLGGPGAAALGAVFTRWADVVGPLVADHSWPVSLVRGVLVVGVDEPIWHTQLTYLQADIVERLEPVVGPGEITRVEVRVRPR
jgi:predicted nucleic acid-binding Zn ribbon protein